MSQGLQSIDKLTKGAKIVEAFEAAEAAPKKPPEDPPGPPSDDEMLASCPVQPLGTRKGLYFYINPQGEVRELRDSAHRWQGITALFGGDLSWLFEHFSRQTEGVVTGWQERKAAAWLIKQCARRGLFDPSHGLRGPGVWRGTDKGLIVHCGDAIHDGKSWRAAGCEIDGIHYPAYPAEPRPDFANPATAEDAAYLHDHLGMWAWRNPPGATRMVHGWLMCAMISGAIHWLNYSWDCSH